MRLACSACLGSSIFLTSCVTHVGGVAAFGPVWLVSRDDIQAAIAADQRSGHDLPQDGIYSVEIVGHNTIHVHHDSNPGRYCEARRTNRIWVYVGETVLLE